MIAMLMLAINHDDIDGNDENVFVKWDQSLFADRALIISTNFEFILVYIYQTIRGGVKNLFTESVHKRGEDFLQLNLFSGAMVVMNKDNVDGDDDDDIAFSPGEGMFER